RAELGVVGPDALEDAGAVVEAVREYVDLGVLPGDEVSVHPDEVGLVHVNLLGAVRARPGWPRPSWPPRPGPGCEDRQRARDRPRILERRPPPAYRVRGGASSRRTGTSPGGWPAPSRRCRAPSRAPARTVPARRRRARHWEAGRSSR